MLFRSRKLDNREDMISECDRLIKSGISVVVLSLGQDGAMFFNRENKLYVKALDVKVNSTVGAGDSMMAAFAYGVHHNLDFEETAKLSMAISGAKVTCEGTGMPEKEQIVHLLSKVRVEKIG